MYPPVISKEEIIVELGYLPNRIKKMLVQAVKERKPVYLVGKKKADNGTSKN